MCLFLKTKGCTSLQKANHPSFTRLMTVSTFGSHRIRAFRKKNGHCFRKERNYVQDKKEKDAGKKQVKEYIFALKL